MTVAVRNLRFHVEEEGKGVDPEAGKQPLPLFEESMEFIRPHLRVFSSLIHSTPSPVLERAVLEPCFSQGNKIKADKDKVKEFRTSIRPGARGPLVDSLTRPWRRGHRAMASNEVAMASI